MVFKIDYRGDKVIEWYREESGADYKRIDDYYPTIYISSQDSSGLQDTDITNDRRVADAGIEEWRTGLGEEKKEVLRLDIESIEHLRDIAYTVKYSKGPGNFKFYNIDFSREFRYCLERQVDPYPREKLSKMGLKLHEQHLSKGRIEKLKVDGEKLAGTPEKVVESLTELFEGKDPDVLVVNSSKIFPLIEKKADENSQRIQLGRLPGIDKLAGENTFESYGRVGHSPARFNIPGRCVIDTSNSFFWNQTSLEGMIDLVERSWKPLQECSWASIGNVLTAIQIRKAFHERDVLIPWNKWEPEMFKSIDTLHSSDRGGFIFQPKVGLHEDVYEADFSSLYPNIMVEKNISPETVMCDCHSNSRVPELGYTVCEKDGFIPEVLEPLVTDRAELKQRIRETDDETLEKKLRSKSNAIKWILVSCFGYQGYRNSKFGRIECHEAINAYAREIMLEAKKIFERNGWEVVHGIIDSIWLKPVEEKPADIEELAAKVSEKVGIELEFEDRYDWVCFVPRRDSNTGALTRYFGKKRSGNGYKTRGIEMRQRSTCNYVKTCQEMMIRSLDRHQKPEKVIEVLKKQLIDLNSGGVKPKDLTIKKRVSKPLEEYRQYTRNVAALERAKDLGVEKSPGESIEYVVIDDSRQDMNRVKLGFEDINWYDEDFYTEQLIRAAESVLSPMDWKRDRIKAYLSNSKTVGIDSFV